MFNCIYYLLLLQLKLSFHSTKLYTKPYILFCFLINNIHFPKELSKLYIVAVRYPVHYDTMRIQIMTCLWCRCPAAVCWWCWRCAWAGARSRTTSLSTSAPSPTPRTGWAPIRGRHCVTWPHPGQWQVAGDIFVLDEKTVYIQDVSHDGQAPDVFFWADGVIVPYITRCTQSWSK